MNLPRYADLQWQKEIIERWLNTPGIPSDAVIGLSEMLKVVNQELEEVVPRSVREGRKKRAS